MEHLNLSFCMNFLKISNEIGRASCKHHLACDCARLCQIWGHLNNARLINCPQVANWGWKTTWSTHRTSPALRERIVIERFFFFMFIIFNGHYLIQICHKWRFQKILSNFELVMNLGSFGQTMVDQSLWIVYFRFVQMVYFGHHVMCH